VHKDEFPIPQDVPDNKNVGAPLAGALGGNDAHMDTMNGNDAHTDTMNGDDAHTVKQDMGTLDNPLITENVGAPLAGALNDAIPFALVSQTAITEASRRLPSLRVIGQLSQSYIVTEGPEGMYLVDQHAAHERILLERMVAALKARAPVSQILLTSMQLELAPSELEAIEDYRQQLEHIGFALELLDTSTIAITAVPNVLVKQMNARSLRELLADLTTVENTGHSETWEEHALANVACKAAIKANYFLTVSEMREMIEQLGQTNAPFSCCHGRPTMVHFSLSALEHEFGRR
jgi:DNA mismatch repair protein MutL